MPGFVITGGTGLLGSEIARQLVDQGYGVRLLDNFVSGHMDNISAIRGRVDLMMGDVCRREDVMKATDGAEVVFHCAALTDPLRSWRDQESVADTNINGTLCLLSACRDTGVKRVVFASCGSVYGQGEESPRAEDFPMRPGTPLAISKLAAERYCLAWGEQHPFDVVCLRFFDMYGPCRPQTMDDSRVLLRIIRESVGDRPFSLPTGSENIQRDFTYVADAARAAISAMRLSKTNLSGKTINVGQGKASTYNQVVDELSSILGKKITPNQSPQRMGEPDYNIADISLAEGLLDYEPSISLQEGLKRTVEIMQEDEGRRK